MCERRIHIKEHDSGKFKTNILPIGRKIFRGSKLSACLIFAVGWILLAQPGAILANPPDENGNHNHGGGGGGGDSGGKIAVAVTFRDFQGGVGVDPDRIMSDCFNCITTCDCQSPYIEKADRVGAILGSAKGNLVMGLGKANKPAIRTLFLDFSDCIEEPCSPIFQNGFVGSLNLFTSGVDLREMFVGEVRGDLNLKIAIDQSSIGEGLWQLFFNPSDDRCLGSSTVMVTRSDADTWEIEAGPTDNACLAEHGGGGNLIFSGLYHMPFKIIVRKI